MENHNTTPETDANAECEQENGSPFAPVREWVHAGFARRLEQQRNEARKDREEAWELLKRISRKGEFMDREGLRLLVGDWLAYRGISVRNLSLENADEPVTLIHNGVGIADMYQPSELEKELRSMTGAKPQNA